MHPRTLSPKRALHNGCEIMDPTFNGFSVTYTPVGLSTRLELEIRALADQEDRRRRRNVPRVCEVLAGVVKDVIGAQILHPADVRGSAAHGGHFGAERLCDLDGDVPDAAGGPVDQHPLARRARPATSRSPCNAVIVAVGRAAAC